MFSNLLLDEDLTKVQWLGVVLTLGSIYLVSIRGNESKVSEEISEGQEILESTSETVGLEQN
jgi:hypothetical protein